MNSNSLAAAVLSGALCLTCINAEATVIFDVATGRAHAVNDGKPYRVTVDSGKGIAAAVAIEGVAYWIDQGFANSTPGVNKVPWKGLFGSGGSQKENLQASWNMNNEVYEANKRVLQGNSGYGSKIEYRQMSLYEKQIVSERTLPGYTNLTAK